MELATFTARIEEAYKAQFPKAWIQFSYSKNLAEAFWIRFGIQPTEKLFNGYRENDPALHSIVTFDIKDGVLSDKIGAEASQGGSMRIKPAEGSYMAYDRVKIGYRKKTATPEKIIEHLTKYFAKMRKVVDEQADNLAHDLG